MKSMGVVKSIRTILPSSQQRQAILGSLIIGVVENLTVQFIGSSYRDIIGFLVMVVILIVRPQGLLGSKMRVV